MCTDWEGNGNVSALLDADGNLTSDGLWTYPWDVDGARKRVDGARQSGVPEAKRRVRKAGAHRAADEQNRLTAMTMKSGLPTGMIRKRLEFTYDYLGRRVQKKVLNNWTGTSGTTVTHLKYVYDGHNLIAELNGSNNTVLSTYVWGLDLSGTMQGAGGVGGLLMVKEGSKTYFPAYDGNGNVSALLDSADGSLDAKYEYGAFGEPLRVGGTAIAEDNPFRFSTKYTDTESGLVYYGFRYYSPSLGRFLNRDPIEELGGSNLYAFVENDPVNGWDYLGLDDELLCDPADYSAGLCDDDGKGIAVLDEVVFVYNQDEDSEKSQSSQRTGISIGYTKVTDDLHHSFVIATDPITGEQWITRGGPSIKGTGSPGSSSAVASSSSGGSVSATAGSGGSGGFGYGYVKGEGGPWNEQLRFDRPSDTVHIQDVGFIDVSFQEVVNRMVEFQNATNLNKIPYWPLGPNSNSYTFTFIESLGFYRVGADLMVPGHGHGTPSNKLSYFSP